MVDPFTILMNVLNPQILVAILIAALYGLFVGSMPGLTATMAASLLLPFAFWLDPLTALAMIVTMDVLAIYSGDIPAAFARIPGTPASAAYTSDMYELTKKGEALTALGVSLMASTLGGIIGVLALWFFAPPLANFAMNFSSVEFFWLALYGLSTGVLATTGSKLKAFISMLLGVLIATIGVDPLYSVPRFTFGIDELYGGISFISAMIGLYGVSEVLRRVNEIGKGHLIKMETKLRLPLLSLVKNSFKNIIRHIRQFITGTILGIIVGALPGAGADVAAWLSYSISMYTSKKREEYGKGSIEGIIAGTSSNNASLGGAWIPSLVFGIPGDSVTAIVIGVMMMKGLTPGPRIFAEQGELVYTLFTIFLLANILIIPLGYLTILVLYRMFTRIPESILVPVILIFCIVGTYAIDYSIFSILVMLVFGILGFFMEKYGFPFAPMVLGIILGPIIETYFMMSIRKSDPLIFFTRPISLAIIIIMILTWILPYLARKIMK